MRLHLLLAVTASLSAAALPALAAGSLTVGIDEAIPVTLGGPMNNVVVGNPSVADINVIDGRRFTILGRGFGVTNVMAFDQGGRTIYNAKIVVGPTDVGRVSVFRGGQTYNYACTTRCERSPMAGESGPDVYGPYAQSAKDHIERAKGAAGGG